MPGLGRAFDAMALEVAQTQKKLRQDIDERMRAAEALRMSEASYRAIFDAAEDSIFVHDIESGAIVDVNPKACAIFGYTRDEFRTIDIGTLGTGERPYTQQDAMALIARAAAGEPLRVEWHGRTRDGTLRWHEVYVRRVTIGGHGSRPGARPRRDRCAGAPRRRFVPAKSSTMPCSTRRSTGLRCGTPSGKVVDTNPALWRMYGYDEAEAAYAVAGKLYRALLPSASSCVRSRAGRIAAAEVTDERKDGSLLELECHGIPMQYQGSRTC